MIGGPYGILVATIALGVALGGSYLKGRTDGRALERAAWSERAVIEAQEAAAALEAARAAAAEKTAALSRAHNEASRRYQEEIVHAKTERDRVALRLRDAIRLRDAATARLEAHRGEGAAPAAPGRCDGPSGGELSQPLGNAARELGYAGIELMAEADQVVRQLTACQAILRQQ